MSKFLGLIFLIVGAILIYYGWQAHQSIASSASNAVTGAPTSKSIWLLALGAIAALWGLYSIFRRSV